MQRDRQEGERVSALTRAKEVDDTLSVILMKGF